MEMTQKNVAELNGLALRYSLAIAMGFKVPSRLPDIAGRRRFDVIRPEKLHLASTGFGTPLGLWMPALEPLLVTYKVGVCADPAKGWVARSFMDATEYYGESPLVAVMRCVVANELGNEVEVPLELIV